MSGFGGQGQRPMMRDMVDYPGFLEIKLPHYARGSVSLMTAPKAIGPVRYAERDALEPISRASTRRARDAGFVETFWTVPSPGIVAARCERALSLAENVDAVAAALRTEYEAMIAAGHVLQVDAPDLAMERHTLFADRPLREFLGFVDAPSPRSIARSRTCRAIACDYTSAGATTRRRTPATSSSTRCCRICYRSARRRARALDGQPAPRPRAPLPRAARLPEGVLLVAGVIDTTTNYVEHPEVVAERIEQAAIAVGDARRVLAGTDCGFDTAAGMGQVAE